jgi:hypothetical protein
MADKTTPPEPTEGDDKENSFAVIDMTKPVFVVFHQTETRNNIEVFQGPDAEANAKARASQKAVRTKAKVAVFGPQKCVFEPPEPSKAKEVQLDWLAE